jgi:sugar phosphate isomerase/epimerase
MKSGFCSKKLLARRIVMKLGVFTALLSQLPLDDMLKKLTSLDIHSVELGTGNYPGDAHCKLSLLEDELELQKFRDTLARYNVSISALSCHGNPLHPDPERAKLDRKVNQNTVLLAEKLGVPVVIDFSGCPGDSPNSKAPNWVTCPWPPEYVDVLNWQWNEVVTPYWIERAAFAADHGVRIAIEMHPGFVVYNPETLLRLRSIAGPSIGCNYDPSHMFWQNIDPIAAIRVLGEAVFHVHRRIHRSTPPTYRRPACWTRSHIRTSGTEAGYSVPAGTDMMLRGGKSLFQHCASMDMTECFR